MENKSHSFLLDWTINFIKNKDTIEKISREAFAEKDELLKIKKLCELEGVGIPTASALLPVVFPKQYAVIDVRCLETLKEKFNYK